MKFYQLTPQLVAALETARLSSYEQERVNALYDEIQQCTGMTEYCLTAILNSDTLDGALCTIKMQEEDFLDNVLWKIKQSIELDRLNKLQFYHFFAIEAAEILVRKRFEMDSIHSMCLDQILQNA